MAAATNMLEEDPPFESFSCPITGALMEDPVMTIGACEPACAKRELGLALALALGYLLLGGCQGKGKASAVRTLTVDT